MENIWDATRDVFFGITKGTETVVSIIDSLLNLDYSKYYEIVLENLSNNSDKKDYNNIYTIANVVKSDLGDLDFYYKGKYQHSIRWMGYFELLIPDSVNGIYYDYVSVSNEQTTISTSDLYLEDIEGVMVNDKRFNMFDMNVVAVQEFENTEEFPLYKYINFANPNDKTKKMDVKVKLLKLTTLVVESEDYYVEKQVDRTSLFIYFPYTCVYLLIDSINKKIYCMQSLTNNGDKEDVTPDNIIYLGNKLTLPEGWLFTICNLSDKCLMLSSNIDHRAKVVNDSYGNSYQYVRNEEALFLYESVFPSE